MIICLMLNTCQKFVYKFFGRAEKVNRSVIWNKIKCRKLLSQKTRRPSSVFNKNHVFIVEEHIASDKFDMAEEELVGIDMDSIRNLVGLPNL